MSTSTHPAALFEEGFALVSVEESEVIQYGAPALHQMIQEHPWVEDQGLPVAIVYNTSGGMQAYGSDEIVNAVTAMSFDEIVWGHELTLEWTDEDEEDEEDEDEDEEDEDEDEEDEDEEDEEDEDE